MSHDDKRPVISPAMLPTQGISEVRAGGRTYLQRNDAMFTGMKHSQAEFSEFFLALRDEGRVLGRRCPQCKHVIVPPFMTRCPACNFVEMETVHLRDVGMMVATPVITVFAPSRFKGQEPFGTGRVFVETLDGKLTDTAILVRVRTTQGTIRPGIYKKGTLVKLAFRNQRTGEILDLFAVPQSELTPAQIAKSPLLESDIEWGRLSQLQLGVPTPESQAAVQQIRTHFRELASLVLGSPRATANLANWRRTVTVRTGGGSLSFAVEDGKLRLLEQTRDDADLIVWLKDPRVFLDWLLDSTQRLGEEVKSPALTDLVIDGTLVLNKPELETITRLDRVPRSLRRDHIPATAKASR